MGKRRESDPVEEDADINCPDTPSHKKHKKHKKKHKKNKHCDADHSSEYISVDDDSPKPAIKLKFKLGKETLGTTSFTKTELACAEAVPLPPPLLSGIDNKEHDGDTSDEEKKWLDALEKGDLDDNGELKKNDGATPTKQLTSRQKALLHGKKEKEFIPLPTEKTVELTEEQLARRQQRATKRRQQAQEKQEKDKKQTLDRLLKKQDSKSKATKTKVSKKTNIPRVRYLSNKSGISVSIPQGFSYPLTAKGPLPPLKHEVCGVEGCNNLKTYTCSETKIPLCSFGCYKKNLLAAKKALELSAP